MTSINNRPHAILLDRDGVINFDSPDYILTPEQWQPIPNSLEAIAQLNAHNIPVGLISNQSAVGRGMMSQEVLDAIHQRMIDALSAVGGSLQHIAYCPHHPEAGCICRKPLPGMIQHTLEAWNMHEHAASIVMIGDSLRDVQAALAAGVRPILVQSGYGDAASIMQRARALSPSILIFPDLHQAVQHLLTQGLPS